MNIEQEALGLLREAEEEVRRAVRDGGVKDWVSVTRFSQLAIEKSAKAVIACFEAFRWTHDPSEQLRTLVQGGFLSEGFLEMASYAEDAAPWHGLFSYGRREGSEWRSPSAFCTEEVAMRLLNWAKLCVERTQAFIKGRTAQ